MTGWLSRRWVNDEWTPMMFWSALRSLCRQVMCCRAVYSDGDWWSVTLTTRPGIPHYYVLKLKNSPSFSSPVGAMLKGNKKTANKHLPSCHTQKRIVKRKIHESMKIIPLIRCVHLHGKEQVTRVSKDWTPTSRNYLRQKQFIAVGVNSLFSICPAELVVWMCLLILKYVVHHGTISVRSNPGHWMASP